MLNNKPGLQVGSEYHESLVSFIHKENEQGFLSLKNHYKITFLKVGMFLLFLVSAFGFIASLYFFYRYASVLEILGMVFFGFMCISVATVLSVLSFGLQAKVECIDARFNESSLLRLIKHDAPDDVINSILRAIGRTGDLSYSEVYDIYWLCSRTSDEVDRATLLGERYQQVKKRVRNRNFIKKNT